MKKSAEKLRKAQKRKRVSDVQLSDRSIRELIDSGKLGPGPFNYESIQPASLDLHIGNHWARIAESTPAVIDAVERDAIYSGWKSPKVIMRPREFLLGTTLEHIHVPEHLAAKFEGKSSLGRMGIMTHVTAGFIDPGFEGEITLELVNVGPRPVCLHSGMGIGQLVFTTLDYRAERPYGHPDLGSHYQGQTGATGVRRTAPSGNTVTSVPAEVEQ